MREVYRSTERHHEKIERPTVCSCHLDFKPQTPSECVDANAALSIEEAS
jgi:hypothetical protein